MIQSDIFRINWLLVTLRVKCNKTEHILLSRVVIVREYREEKGVNLYRSVCMFSILFFIHFLWH